MSPKVRASRVNWYWPLDESTIFGVVGRFRDHRLIEAGRQQVDHVHEVDEFLVLFRGHLAGDEDAEMPNALVQRVDDRLAVRDHVVVVLVKIENPVQRLLRRRDVVAARAEHDDRDF